MRSRRIAVLVAVLAVGAFATTASASYFSEARPLGPPGRPAQFGVDAVAVAMNAVGGATVAWTSTPSGGYSPYGPVEAATLVPGRGFTRARTLADSGLVAAAAAGDDGRASATWSVGDAQHQAVWQASGTIDSGLAHPASVFATPVTGGLGVDSAGDAIVVNLPETGDGWNANVACRRAGADFGPVTAIRSHPRLMTVDAAGEPVLLEGVPVAGPAADLNPNPEGVSFRECLPDGTLSGPDLLSAQHENTSGGSVASNARGDMIVTWSSGGGAVSKAVLREHGGAFGPPLQGPGVADIAALDPGGDAILVGDTPSGSVSVYIPAGGAPEQPETLPGTEHAGVSAVGFDALGDAVAVGWTNNGLPHRLLASVRLPGGGWSAAQTLFETTDDPPFLPVPKLAFDAHGGGLVAWMDVPQLYVAAYDATGAPVISLLPVRTRPRPTLRFRLSAAARVRVIVDPGGRGAHAAGARHLLSIVVRARRGLNRLTLRSRSGRPLRHGRYRVTLIATGRHARAPRWLSFAVRL
jgi:hypothetical protein